MTVAATARIARRRRVVAVTSGLGVIVAALLVGTMMIGDVALGPWEVFAAVTRLGDDAAVDFIVLELRLPTASTALVAGVALGVAGMIFQTLLANPLASPDLIGISSGASLFAVGSIVFLHASAIVVAGAALSGAFLAAALIYVLAFRDGLTGYRFILVGIGVTEFVTALIAWVLAKAEINDAREAMTWLVGSVGQAGSLQLQLLAGGVAVLVPLAMAAGRILRLLELGDDSAHGLGLRVEGARLAMIGVAVTLTALATAAVGPLAFVALTAGPIAARLLRGAGVGILSAGLVGAVVVLAGDLVAAHALPVALPTGVVTGAVGAPYLIWLLATVNREGRGG
ncbi:iron chelate uptake ABC transporter family permease subunit [Mycobacterium sp. 236(2023)]|uniref:FecCD family ABC transporter permease n=1 Tax=Mycobacterium sp. 236(2023) TaxID=3038163 RepID=UPI0024153DF0|nr:iron chelate uptake ABC transporter family permease subunit [Mycobacterium sp. 236(2023)]MDG4666983.1 iron chelate uptake ABC transporter family permease subunit [Mycobacterium sp. 236(2023)]